MTGGKRWPAPAPGRVQIIPLGGLGEIGKNCWCVRTSEALVVLDAGFAFPTEEMYGVDVVLPDYTFLEEHAGSLDAIVISHGHEDHIGGLPYMLKAVKAPVYGTALTLSLVEGKLPEHGLAGKVTLNRVKPRDVVAIKDLKLEFIRVCHSIADAVAIAVHTPLGPVLYTGDFKFDPTPIDGELTDYFKLTELGEKGLKLLLSDSTNVTKKGFTPSEAAVAPALDASFAQAGGRIVVATFASNIHRVQQILDAAARHDRRVLLLGRSMLNVSQRAHALGYLNYPEGLLLDLEEARELPHEELVILTTGSQGEPMAGLSRLATSDLKGFTVQDGDTVLISAIPIPGNERSVGRLINMLTEKGANVIYESVQQGTHVSGHASEEELKLMLAMTKPEYFVPVHGETRHLVRHAALAGKMGVDPEKTFILGNGDVLELSEAGAAVVDQVPRGPVLLDGHMLRDVGQGLLRDRQRLAADGVASVTIVLDADGRLVGTPEILTKGFVYVADAQPLMDEGKRRIVEALDWCSDRGIKDEERIRRSVVEALSRFFNEQTHRRPVQLVTIQQLA